MRIAILNTASTSRRPEAERKSYEFTPMKTESPSLPPGVAEAWFHISCGGEVWTSRVCRGRDLLKVLDEIAPDAERYAEDLADPGFWYELDGVCRSCSLPCGEDPDIEVALIDDPAFTSLAEHCLSLRKLLVGFVQLTNREAKDGGVTLDYDNYHDGARVRDGDGKVIAECYDSMGEDDIETDCGDRQCIEAMRRAVMGEKPTG
jgi:hypothetical protein